MTQPNDTSTPAPVSIVTKHIKIYSDNPIHDCIDRIIDACVGLDMGDDDALFYAIELSEATDKLHELAFSRRVEENNLYRKGIYDKKPN
jgi:hypothetical protein